MVAAWRTRVRALLPRRRARRPGLSLRFYTRADCPLCDAMEEQLRAVRWARLGVDPAGVRVERRDVDSRDEWRERYGLSVPVLEQGGRALAKGRTTREELERRLARRLERAGGRDCDG